MISRKYLFLLCAILAEVQAKYNKSVCSFETFNCGPIPPTIKESFVVKGEYINYDEGTTTWQEEYFDAPNLRAKYKMVSNGLELHFIFNYDMEEIITYEVIHPGAPAENDPSSYLTCKTMDLGDSPLRDLYGYLYKNQEVKHSRMYDSSRVFHFGGDYKYAFVENSTLKERQIPYVKYHGCVYDESSDATFDKTFYWSREDVLVGSGEDTIPVKIDTFGSQIFYPNFDGVPAVNTFNYTENIVWYQGNPEFDEDTFQIPVAMYCEDLRSNMKVPNIPKTFSARLEETLLKFSMDGNILDVGFMWNSEMWYDGDANLLRVDYVPDLDDFDVLEVFGRTPVSAIFDASQGVVYYTSKISGFCAAFEIPSDSVYISKNFERKLATPDEILGISDDMVHKGKGSFRDILCNVWIDRYQDDQNETVIVELYTTTEGWHTESEEDEEFDVPVRMQEITFVRNENEEYELTTESNIFNFKRVKPPLSVFDITNCLANQNHFFLSFAIQQNSLLPDKLQNNFLQSVRQAIADFSQIGSVVLVQNIELFLAPASKSMRVNFLLLDQPKLVGKNKKQPGTSLNTAFNNLKAAIDTGSFTILFVVDPTAGAETIRATPNTLIKLLQSSEPFHSEEEESYVPRKGGIDILGDPEFGPQAADEASQPTTVQGYSSGLLAGVGLIMLAVGIGIGIGMMYLYIKKYGGGPDGDTLVMQERS